MFIEEVICFYTAMKIYDFMLMSYLVREKDSRQN
jgi:hypothetical protein